MTEAIRAHIDQAADAASLERVLLRALVLQESGGNPYAIRPEPRYRYLMNVRTWKPFRELLPDELASKIAPADFPFLAGSREQEWWLQQCSIGLCQVMGAVARELGFRGPYLTALTDPVVNLGLAARILTGNLTWAGGNVRKALAAYNAGRGGWSRGLDYADEVLGRMA